jgi:hypothetical protein
MGTAEDSKDISRVQSREKNGETAIVSEKYADVTLRLVEQYGEQFGPLTPEKEKKLRRKLYWHVMGLLSAINLLLFVRHLASRYYHHAKLYRLINQLLDMPLFSACLRKQVSAKHNIITLELFSMSVRTPP